MDRQADILAAPATPFAPAPLVQGGMRVDGHFYASTELETARLSGVGPTVPAAVDPVDPTFAFAILPGQFQLVRAEVVFARGDYMREMLALVRVLHEIDAVLGEESR